MYVGCKFIEDWGILEVDGAARLTYSRQAGDLSAEEPNTRLTRSWAPELSWPDKQNDTQVIQGYATELIAFCDAVREGREVSPSIDDGTAVMRMIEAIAAAPDGTSVLDLHAERVEYGHAHGEWHCRAGAAGGRIPPQRH